MLNMIEDKDVCERERKVYNKYVKQSGEKAIFHESMLRKVEVVGVFPLKLNPQVKGDK